MSVDHGPRMGAHAPTTANRKDGLVRTDPKAEYSALLARGHALYPGVRIGRPGRSAWYWPTITGMRLLRAKWRVVVDGSELVAPGAAILIGNHVSMLDPVVAVMSHRWRISAFTKVEAFEGAGGIFFRLMGQIPLRRGDEAATSWAMDMASFALASGSKIGLYPEGTRSPDRQLHRLHKRVMIPLIQANPDVPVHAISTRYGSKKGWRTTVEVHLSERLAIDPSSMTAQEITDAVRDALLSLGGQTYVDRYAGDVKRELSNLP